MVVALTFAICALSVHPFHRATGSVLVVSFFLIPTVLAGAFWGKRGGIAAGSLSLAASCILVKLVFPSQLLSTGTQGLVFFVGVGGVVGHVADLTRRLRAESGRKDQLIEDLARSEARYRSLFDGVPVGVYRTEPSGTIVAANRALADILGYADVGDLLRANASDLYADPAKRRELAAALAQSGTVSDFEAEVNRRDGATVWVAITATAEVDDAGTVRAMEGTIRDTSEHRRLEALRQRLEKTEAAGQLAAGVAHDFNNILAGIRVHAQYLLRRAATADQVAAASARQIIHASDRAARIADGLLLSAGSSASDQEPCELSHEVGDFANNVGTEVAPGVRLELSLAAAPLRVALDRPLFAQALREIVDNAVAATRGSGTIRLSTGAAPVDLAHVYATSAEPTALHAFVSVQDSGSGMDHDTLSRMFEPYFTTQAFGRGAGLGLLRVNGIVRQHQGAVAVQSGLGIGTTVTMYFPLLEERGGDRE